MPSTPELPDDIRALERGWLSSNNILLMSEHEASLVDSGYSSHAPQTLSLVETALGPRSLTLLLNTHLHSDHCGGNAALQARFPDLMTLIPPGQSDEVRRWDTTALTYAPTGQTCPRFTFDTTLKPGTTQRLGLRDWQIHAAPGHDPHSVVLFEPDLGILISADALWESGFGVVFPEIEGLHAFAEVAATLDLIESLHPRIVIPGHGPCFDDVAKALDVARLRLSHFVADPLRHARHAAKVLIKFKLLEMQSYPLMAFRQWVDQTAYFSMLHQTHFGHEDFSLWMDGLVADLVRSHAARLESDAVVNC
jgi:glyoxylase-like metal-dependent hydrolase (beta-lactamase superfamily II)